MTDVHPALAAWAQTHEGTGLDLSRPVDNLVAFGKTWSTFGDEPVVGVFHGTMYGWFPGRRIVPLFGFAGTGVTKARLDRDPASGAWSLTLRGKETGYFTDLATGEVLDTWHNPFTDEMVEVYAFHNDRIGGVVGEQMPVLTVGDHHDEGARMNDDGTAPADAAVPFVLPWQEYGDEVLLEWDYAHEYPNPVVPLAFPRSSTGERINPSEHFVIYTSRRELDDLARPSAHFRAGFSRVSPWWPWMRMGGVVLDTPQGPSAGVMTGRMFSRTARRGLDDVPRPLLDRVMRDDPALLELPEDWETGPILSTWEAYARDTPPEA